VHCHQANRRGHAIRIFGQFREGLVEGLTLGFGGDYQSKRAYLTGFTVGGNAVTDENGNRISLYTDEKLILNAMAKYEFTLFDDNPSNIQLNVDNITDDKALYGYVYESGLSWRVFFGTTF
jgi:outer membrane receptor for monomeric catechols